MSTPDIKALIEHEQERIAYYKSHMEYHAAHLQAILKIQELAESRSKAAESPEVHEYPVGYRKSATGAMEPRTVDVRRGESISPAGEYTTYNPVGNVQKPDIRVDPPYDR